MVRKMMNLEKIVCKKIYTFIVLAFFFTSNGNAATQAEDSVRTEAKTEKVGKGDEADLIDELARLTIVQLKHAGINEDNKRIKAARLKKPHHHQCAGYLINQTDSPCSVPLHFSPDDLRAAVHETYSEEQMYKLFYVSETWMTDDKANHRELAQIMFAHVRLKKLFSDWAFYLMADPKNVARSYDALREMLDSKCPKIHTSCTHCRCRYSDPLAIADFLMLLQLYKNKSAGKFMLSYVDAQGNTMGHLAAREGSHQQLHVLILAGTDMGAANNAGDLPLHIFLRKHNTARAAPFIQLIINFMQSADLDRPNKRGESCNDLLKRRLRSTGKKR